MGGLLALTILSTAHAQEKPYTQAGTAIPVPPPVPKPAASAPDTDSKSVVPPAAPTQDLITNFFNGKIPEAIAKGKFSLNTRLRYEWVDQSTFKEEANAPTIRTRFGYTTAPLYGFQGMIEGENISVIGSKKNYNAAGSNNTTDRPIVQDPPTTEVNQAWLSYNYTNWVTARGGRQRLVLDNHRFIGDSAWRQNQQTFDAITIGSTPLPDLSLFYGYIWEANRVFGDVDGLPPANRDFDSDSHLVNVSYSGWKYARIVGYTYLLDLENRAGTANSCATYGGYIAGSAPVGEKVSVGYRGEFAYQTEYANSPLDYGAEYYNIEASATIQPISFGAGCEVLGTDSNDAGAGSASFRTPLATLHPFNGWANVFLTVPPRGLRDAYGFVQITLPYDIPVRAIYHSFEADSGGADFGQEFDIMASKKFGKYWTVTAKYAHYDGKEAPVRFD
ncbi:MAG TPA: alginate export family protein, partial [Candidatus Limnocylindria bacterium]|nr:alginate export family protein [Candidatus Limnocylindria bacterium]